MKKIILLLVFLISVTTYSQVGIGTTTPDLSSALDVKSTNTGVLIPRVALSSTTLATPVTTPIESLLVYNTATTGDVTPGFYYWSGAIWRRLAAGASPILAQNGLNINTTTPNASVTNPYVEIGGSLVRNTTVDFGAYNMTYDLLGTGYFRVNHTSTTPATTATYPFGVSRAGTTDYTIGSDGTYVYNQSWSSKPLVINNQGNNTLLNPSSGNVGVGLLAPNNKFDLASATRSGTHATGLPFYATGTVSAGSSGFEFRHTNATQGIGLGFNTVYATGSNTNQDLGLASRGTGNLNFSTNGTRRMIILGSNGNVGVGIDAPTSRLHASANLSNDPVIYGINTNTSSGTTSYGVRGESGSTGLGSAGVSGVSTNSSENEIGVLGDYSLWGTGIFGLGWDGSYSHMPSGRDFGVFGTVNFDTGTGVYGRNSNTTVGSAYGVYCRGNFAVTGAKSASVPTSKGNQLLYCTESPELWFEDLGGGKLTNGNIHIALDPMFIETIFTDEEHPLRVFIQEEGESNGLIVIKDADNKGFTVKEKGNGTSNISFSYRIMAKRRFYQNQRFGVDANQPFENNLSTAKDEKVTTTDPEEMKRFVEEVTRSKEKKSVK